ncbi:type VII secretion protein EccB [Mycobacterium riyadhense]|uniref:Type VII secretion protein EccB n=1 Tax=Mycobacterium riyadhense TaxID=486698 RepID=A0A1X2B9E7_9MYCO|nr:type VII secretion protein EccB [Mycobacterium riyadhense]MCV7146978.1 type VII secretion protein EccB [Mycobacterium riyadhense]ORW60222.1 type VII secretion protein EccB [Mycobacterium riyadhense]
MAAGLNYASLEQVSAWRFLRHRVKVAIGRRNVRLVHDPSKNATASLVVGSVAAVLILGICAIVAWIKPVGQVGRSQIVADRTSGAIYVNVGGVLHPALNLASARLIAGTADNPTMVPMSEILKNPIGPMVGILGAPNDLSARTPGGTGWALCDRLGSSGSLVVPKVTVIDGMATLGEWAHQVVAPQAALMTYGAAVFVVSDGHRSEIDLADKPVTLALGLPVGDLHPAAMSRALYEALTPSAPLRVPSVPDPGAPVSYASPSLPLVSGSVVRVSDVTGEPEFFVALPAGMQRVPQTVATMIVNAGVVPAAQAIAAASSAVATLPQATGFDVSVYPRGAVQLLDKSVEPVTCVMWRKTNGEPQAQVTTISGRRLPIPVGDERRGIPLVSAGIDTADEVFVRADAANFVQVTGMQPISTRGESLWFIGDNGVRYGIPTAGNGDEQTLQSLGFKDISPTPAPWAVIRWLPAGPALSKAAALSQHDTLPPDPFVAPLPTPKAQVSGAH